MPVLPQAPAVSTYSEILDMALKMPMGIFHHGLATTYPQTCQANIQFFEFLLNAITLCLVADHKVAFAATPHVVREA